MGEESDALDAQAEGCENLELGDMELAYNEAKQVPVNERATCVCGISFTKRTRQQAFCCNKGPGNCKDWYWNMTSEKRRDRAISRSQG